MKPQYHGMGESLRQAIPSLKRQLNGVSSAWTASSSVILWFVVFSGIFVVNRFAIGKVGLTNFTVFLAISIVGFLYAYVSWRSLLIPFFISILSVGGFKFLWSVDMPGLPDLYIDRVAMIWLMMVFWVKFVMERRTLRPPFLLDTLLLINALFLFFFILYYNFDNFNLWTKSYVIPYLAFFAAKNIVTDQRSMRAMLILLAVLNVYYAVTSIGEKFDLPLLVWPHSILTTETVWWRRSNGPFAHAPLFGTVQGMILPTYLYIIATTKNRIAQIAGYAGLALGVVGLYFTYTRGSWLAGIVAMVVAIVLNKKQYLRIVTPAIIVMPLLAIFVLGIGSDQVMKDRVENEDTMASRVGVATTALRMWRDNPIVGVGFFRYQYERLNYVGPVEVPVFGTVNVANFRHTSIHDIYLGPLAETGIVGTFLQLAIYLVIFNTLLKHYRNPNAPPHFRRYILPVFGGMFCGYLIGGIAIDYRFFSMVEVMFYSAAGIIYGYFGEDEERKNFVAFAPSVELDETKKI